jgi:hypothetical protein
MHAARIHPQPAEIFPSAEPGEYHERETVMPGDSVSLEFNRTARSRNSTVKEDCRA